jgi:predicted transcriptional regulator
MTDNEIRRKLLEHAFLHRYELTHGIVSWKDIDGFAGIGFNVIFQNMKLLKDEGYIEPVDGAWRTYKLTSSGLRLMEDKQRLNSEFPINPEETDFTSTTFQTLESLMSEKFPGPFRQLVKAKSFLYGAESPDIENCIKDSVGALEGLARILLNEPKKTLSDLLPKLRSEFLGHPAMDKILGSLYAIRGDVPGAAHGQHKASDLKLDDAEFVFNTCMACMTYLAKKSEVK